MEELACHYLNSERQSPRLHLTCQSHNMHLVMKTSTSVAADEYSTEAASAMLSGTASTVPIVKATGLQLTR